MKTKQVIKGIQKIDVELYSNWKVEEGNQWQQKS